MINPLILNSKFRVSNLKSVAILFLLLIFSIASTEVIWRVVTPSGHSGLTVKVTMPELTDDESCLASAALLALPDQRLPEIQLFCLDSSIIPAGNFPNLKEKLSDGYDNSMVWVGSEQRLRDLKVAPLVVKPLKYDNERDEIIFYRNIELRISGLPQVNLERVSPAFDLIYRNTVLNYESSGLITPQGYLIIVPDEFYNNILPLARWKEQKGWYVTVTKLSQIGGNNRDLIKNYIANAYATWQIPPEYVLLIGSKDKIQTFPSPRLGFATDYYYSLVDGNDNLADLLVGRMSADNPSELDVIVAKTLGYEKTPYLGDTLWYRKALLVATTYQEGGGRVVTALETKREVKEKFLANGFLRADTVFHDPPYHNPNAPETIRVLVNAGVGIINGRGWGNSDGWQYPTFLSSNVYSLANGWKLPVITSIYCGTGNINANPCFGEVWLRAGTPTSPKGGVAFFGASWMSTSTRFNNCLDYGIYWGIFEEGITNCASAMYRGKLELMKNFPLPCDSVMLRAHLETYNLLGDPSLAIWTAVPKPITVEHPTTIPIGGNYLRIRVIDYNGTPLSGALVSLWKPQEVKITGYTDASGWVGLAIRPTTSDTMFLTVTANNRIPYLASIMVNPTGLYVGYYDHSINNLQPGSVATLSIILKNYGTTQTAYNTSAHLRTSDPYIYITDSIKNYGDIAPQTTASSSPFQFYVAENCPNNHPVNFELIIQSGDSIWHSGVDVIVPAPELIATRHQIIDGGNGYLDPNETADLIVWLRNQGNLTIQNTQAILRTLTNAVTILDSIGNFGTINPNDSAVNSGDHFQIFAQPSCAIGRNVALQLFVTGNGFQTVVNLTIPIGQVTANVPFGPDGYGYFAYDNTDLNYPEHPEYSWVEIDPNFGGSGTRIPLGNDDIKVRPLPFTFRYYGCDYNRVSIGSNGYIAMDSAWLCDPYNWHIPSTMGPPALIAPFWDDLRPDTLNASGIYHYYDQANHRFIVEWSRVHHIHGFLTPIIAELLTFQAILFDPVYYPTRTGDGEIIFQYHTIMNDDSATGFPPNAHNFATCGIENYEQNIGIEYTYANRYPPACAPLINGRAIKFTTNPPDTFIGLFEPKFRISNLICYPNPFTAKTTIRFNGSPKGFSVLKIYNLAGELVKTLAVSGKRSALGELVWDGTDQFNRKVGPGLYFVLGEREKGHRPILKIIKLN